MDWNNSLTIQQLKYNTAAESEKENEPIITLSVIMAKLITAQLISVSVCINILSAQKADTRHDSDSKHDSVGAIQMGLYTNIQMNIQHLTVKLKSGSAYYCSSTLAHAAANQRNFRIVH